MLFSRCLNSEAQLNVKIQRQQKLAREESSKKVSILILGTGDSGKTTFRKQLQNVHTDQYEKEEFRSTFANIVLGNLIDGTVEVLAHLDKKAEEISILKESAREVSTELSPELHARLLNLIWDDPKFMELVKQSTHTNKIQLQDCFLVFANELKEVPNWGLSGWIPSVEDCIRSRVRTSGVTQDSVLINNVPFILYDVGGQRAERRKWIHNFEHCTAAIFVTSISEYDQVLFEDRTKNRLEEALELFKECVNSPWLRTTTTILFLNKQDLFRIKFLDKKIPLNISGKFPTAPVQQENEHDMQVAIDWISSQFTMQKTQEAEMSPSTIYVYVTTATDPDNVKMVFNVCKDVVLKANLTNFGFT